MRERLASLNITGNQREERTMITILLCCIAAPFLLDM